MFPVHPLTMLYRTTAATLCLLASFAPPLGHAQAAPAKPVTAEGAAYNSQDFRFRIVFPRGPSVQAETESSTLFLSTDKDESYLVKVLVLTLDKEAATQDITPYFQQFNRGMKLGGTTVTQCAAGLVSGFPAERCAFSKAETNGLMIVVRRGGAAYFVSGEQERGNFKDAQIEAAVASFRLLPELETFSFAAQGFRADFPTRPKLTELGGGTVVKAYAGKERYMTMVSVDDLGPAQSVADPARLFPAIERSFERTLSSVHMQLSECTAVEFIGSLAAHHCVYDDDKNNGTLLLVRKGKKLYSLLAHQPRGAGSSAELEAFLRSFKFLE